MACKQMFGKVERRMPSALVNDLKSWKAERWKPKAGKVQAKCKSGCAIEDGKALLNYAKQQRTMNNRRTTTANN